MSQFNPAFDSTTILPAYSGFKWLETDIQLYELLFLVAASAVVEAGSNASAIAYVKDDTDPYLQDEVIGHIYEPQFMCTDAFFEIMVGALSTVLLGYQYILNAARVYWLVLMFPYVYQVLRGVLYVTAYCELDGGFITIPIPPTTEELEADTSIPDL